MKTFRKILLMLALLAATAPAAQAQPIILHSFQGTYGVTNYHGANPYAGVILSGGTLYGTTYNGGTSNYGAIFSVNTNGSGYTTLYSFTKQNDGANPYAGLVLSGNTLYGTAYGGGSSNYGTVFALNTDGTGFTTLHSFTNGTDGANPEAGLVLSGNILYGTTYGGGAHGQGSIFSVNTDGTGFTNLHSFTGGADGANPEAGLILSGGTLYGTAYMGGQGFGTLFALNTNGTGFTTLHTFLAQHDAALETDTNADGARPASGLILSGGNLYGTTTDGGTNGYGTLFAVSTNGTVYTRLHTFVLANDGGIPRGTLLLSGTNLYGTATTGGSFSVGTVFAVSTNGAGFTVLRNFADGFGGAYIPEGGLILSGNTLYGTAFYGGLGQAGAVFQINTDGTGYATTCNIVNNSEGVSPMAGLILSGNTLYGTTYSGGSSNYGTVFAVNTDGTGYTNLYNFASGNDGAFPAGGLILAGNTLYGTTENGGANGSGTVFALNTNGTGFTTLHSFAIGNDGGYPQAGLILSGNTLYGTTETGGANSEGTIFAINTDGTGYTTLYAFTAVAYDANTSSFKNNDGAYPLTGLILSGSTLYGTTSTGGLNDRGTVFAVSTSGTGFTTLHNFGATANDSAIGYVTNSDGITPSSLVLAGTTLYGTAPNGGVNGFGTLFAVSTSGTGFTVLHTFTTPPGLVTNSDGANPAGGLLLSGTTLYGTASVAGPKGGGTIFQINTTGGGFTNLWGFYNNITNGLNPQGPLILSGTNLYGTTSHGGTPIGNTSHSDGTVFRLGVPPLPAQITVQPSSVTMLGAGNASYVTYASSSSSYANLPTVKPYQTATFAVGVEGTQPLSCQWYQNGAALTGQTNATLTLTAAPVNAGNYFLVLTNAYGAVTSSVASLTVDEPTATFAYAFDQAVTGYQTNAWQLNGNALWVNDSGYPAMPQRMRMTSNGNGQTGNGWYDPQTISPARSWSFNWTFQVGYYNGTPADGMGFYLQSDGLNDKLSGGGATINGVTNPFLAIFFDTYQNSGDPSASSLKVIYGTGSSQNDFPYVDLTLATNFGTYANSFGGGFTGSTPGAPFNITASYLAESNLLTITAANDALASGTQGSTNNPLIFSYNLNLAAVFGTNVAWAGFSGNTGGAAENSDVVNASGLFYGASPLITTPPASLTLDSGNNASFTVAASGAIPLAYQWQFNGTNISGATNASYSLTGVGTNAAGNYTVVVTNAYGSVKSSVAVLTVIVVPPAISIPPAGTVAVPGAAASLSVTATGSAPLGYQWLKDGVILSGQTNSVLSFAEFQFANCGLYQVVVSNSYGLRISLPAALSVTNAPLRVWGNNSEGQLGIGSIVTQTNMPAGVTSSVVAAAVGYDHSLFVKADGTLWAAGDNNLGELGVGSAITKTNAPVEVTNNVVAVAAGFGDSLFVKTDGTLWAMGINSLGELGIGSISLTNVPVAVATNVVAVATGERHSLFVKADGTLWAMGNNIYGQLGAGAITQTNRPVEVASNVVAVAAGDSHSLFVQADGTLWAMGENNFGQLGIGSTNNIDLPAEVTNNVVAMAAGAEHSLFVKANGTLWAMGENNYGELGIGSTNTTTAPTQVAGNVIAVAAGSGYSLFVKAGGMLWAMGYNMSGELGTGNNASTDLPLLVSGGGLEAASLAQGSLASQALAVAAEPPAFKALTNLTVTLNQPFSFTATVTNGDGPFTYQWQLNGVNIAGATSATYAVAAAALTNAGNYTVVVTGAFASATSSAATLTIGGSLNQTITFGPLAAQTYGAATFNLTATASSGLPVTYSSSNPSVATISGNTVTIQGAGTASITASQAGNASYNAATNVIQILTVNPAAATIHVTGLTQTYNGSALLVSVTTVPAGLPLNVTYNGSGTAPVNPGSYTVVVTVNSTDYSGSVTNTLVVGLEPQTISLLVSITNALPLNQFTNPIPLVATASSGLPVTLSLGTNSAATLTSSNTLVSIGETGTITVEANQAGNADYASAPEVTLTLDVTKGNQTITFNTLANLVATNAPLTLTATASSGLAVQYAVVSGPATVSSNVLTLTGPGTVTVEATQPGDTNWNPAAPVNQSFNVSLATQSISFGPLAEATYGDPSFNLTATASSGLPVTYSSSNPSVAQISGDTVTIIGAGTATITASQDGDGTNYSAAADVQQSLIVDQAAQTITFDPLPYTVQGDAPFTLTATASSGLPVSYASSDSTVAAVSGNTVIVVGPGSATLTASQPGDANNLAATDASQMLVVYPFVLALDIQPGPSTNNVITTAIMTVTGNTNRVYTIIYNTDLTTNNWPVLLSTNLPAPAIQVTVPTTNIPAEFYRLERSIWTP